MSDRPRPAAEPEEDGQGPGRDLAVSARALRKARRRQRNLARILPPGEAPEAEAGDDMAEAPIALPAPPPAGSGEAEAERERRIAAIQRDLARRRRRRALFLALRLLVFVLLPTAIVGRYYFLVATDMYETRSEFVIQKAESAGSPAPGLAGIFSGFGLADSKDSIAVQGYLTSLDAMLRLDAEQGFVAHFSDPRIDSWRRLPPDASRAEAHDLYRRHVTVGFDVTEGILRMSVVAADRETSERFSKALIRYAEEMVDSLSARARAENMEGAERSFAAREADVRAAAARVLELQTRYATFSAEGELQIDLSVIQAQELELEKLRRELNEMRANPRPNPAQLAALERQIAFIESSVAQRRAALTAVGRNGESLARISSELQMAQSDLAAKEQMRVLALNSLEQARVQANRQVRYLSVSVPPIAPDRPTHPRRVENTAIAFVLFLGLYIMVSLTGAVLREQVSV